MNSKQNEIVICKICKQQCNGKSGITVHLQKTHKFNRQQVIEYYDTYFLNENNICICGKKKKFNTFNKGYNMTCGDKKCSYTLSIQHGGDTKFNKYGTRVYVNSAKMKKTIKAKGKNWNNRDQAKKTYLKNTGYDNPMKNPEIQQKARQKDMEIYGVYHHASSPIVINTRGDNNESKYGVRNVFQVDSVKNEIKKTNLTKFGVENPMQNEDIKQKAKNNFKINHNREPGQFTSEQREKGNIVKRSKKYNDLLFNNKYNTKVKPLFSLEEYKGTSYDHSWLCLSCQTEFEDNLNNDKIPRCPKCNPRDYHTSKGQLEVYAFLSQYIICELNIKFKYDKNRSHEIDIYIPSLNIGIEYDGVRYHSDYQGGASPYYHKIKTDYFENMGISLFHITDIEWHNKKEIIKSILLSKINKNQNIIYARKCNIKEVSYKDSKIFLNENHLQKNSNASIRYGLYYKDQLVSLLTLGKSRFNKNYDYELLRFCNILNTSIIGGFSRLLKHFIKNHKGSILSYADRRFSNGDLYYKNNFKLKYITEPNYHYFSMKKADDLYNRINFQKHKLKGILKSFDPKLTEWENMINNNYDRIWDCGNMVFVLE